MCDTGTVPLRLALMRAFEIQQIRENRKRRHRGRADEAIADRRLIAPGRATRQLLHVFQESKEAAQQVARLVTGLVETHRDLRFETAGNAAVTVDAALDEPEAGGGKPPVAAESVEHDRQQRLWIIKPGQDRTRQVAEQFV